MFINETPTEEEFVRTEYRNVEGKPQVVVVGAGPGGLFAALRLIELGLRPVVVERGKNVRDRKTDLARISREHKVARNRTTASAKEVRELTPTASCIRAARSVAAWTRF